MFAAGLANDLELTVVEHQVHAVLPEVCVCVVVSTVQGREGKQSG